MIYFLNSKRKITIFALSFLFAFFFLIFVLNEIHTPKNSQSLEKSLFVIQKGERTKEIAINLEKEGLIKSALLFRLYTLFAGNSGMLQAGYYSLSPSMNIPEIAQKFAFGDIIKDKITIIEGWNLKDIEEQLNSKFKSNPTGSPLRVQQNSKLQFKIQNLKAAEFQKEFDFLKDAPVEANLEGYLFPDTYYIQYDTFSTAVENVSLTEIEKIVRKMLENFGKKLTLDLRDEISQQKKSIFEIITMASLIEKEVKTLEDKKLVSGILWKRLKYGIPLQVDATISYITGKKTTEVSVEETKIDSPYNTYKYRGLPLGPICNPGLDSILAAIYPQESNFWFYLSTPDGKTIFSRTLEEHNIAKAKYLK